ncbi:testis-expressed protein 50 [Loxodonta africana]|uniref:testis-expressed protein 50 n=1 Tax=Loxodonta africana TaxID=9785 RepID=UPI00022344D6|nr:testis-expressed protein 50 [Loxodonta africana]XP_049724447.1 testis-expressed protein 50 [Elephas maximus indicus]
MSTQGLSPIFPLLFICFFRGSFCICDGTIWAKVGWEIFPEEVHYLQVKPSSSHCLPYPLNKLCCSFANMDIFQGCLHLFSILVQAIFLILSVLSAHYLWMKWKKHQKKLKKQVSLDTSGNDLKSRSVSDINQILFRLVAIASMMMKYLKRVSNRRPASMKVKHRKLKKKNGGKGVKRY